MNAKRIKNLTPEESWNEFVSMSVELFLSYFYSDGFTDITEACKKFSQEIPISYEKPFMQEQLDHIALLLNQYINNYINEKGGIDKLRLYTDKELEEIDEKEARELLEMLKEL